MIYLQGLVFSVLLLSLLFKDRKDQNQTQHSLFLLHFSLRLSELLLNIIWARCQCTLITLTYGESLYIDFDGTEILCIVTYAVKHLHVICNNICLLKT